ncbi:hypothetical protein LG302_07100 [Halomonas organivorans]
MKRRRLPRTLGLVLATALLSSPAAFGHGGGGMGHHGMMGDSGPGMGPGMMGGYGPGMGPGMMGGYGPGMGPGMMGGYGPGMGPGMMGGHGPGMGPGMMGGHGPGMGPGMMGGYGPGMEPGMMGGYGPGMGPGMMGGYGPGMGPGMMGGYGPGTDYGFWSLLNDDQREQARTLMQDFRAGQYERGGEMMALQQQLMALLHAEGDIDTDAVADTQARLAELQRQIWQEHRRLHRSLFELLDEEQRRRLSPQTEE